jgi:hypothetical protein
VTNILGTRRFYAKVEKYYYYVGLPIEDDSTGRSLCLSGQTYEANFLHPTELNLELHESKTDPKYEPIESDGLSSIKLGEIVYRAYDGEGDMPELVHGALLIGPQSFSHILEMVKDNLAKQEYSVTVELALFGLDLGLADIRDDKWPNKRKLDILGLQFAQHSTASSSRSAEK